MPRHSPANREAELALFDQMLAGQTRERILLLEAEGGLGKTTLLNEFARRCPAHVPCAPLDLKGSTTGLHEVFYRLCDALGWEHFPAFADQVEGLGRVTVDGNVVIGWGNKIEAALRSPDEGDRAARRAELTRAFFDDLRTMKRRLLFIFDTFEKAPPELGEWLSGDFLAYAHHTPDLIVVVAGRQAPEESIEWGDSCIRRLVRVRDPEPWRIYAERIGAVLPSPEWIRAFCDLLDGHPLEIAKALARYAPAGGRQ
jgi:hypothetical protein